MHSIVFAFYVCAFCVYLVPNLSMGAYVSDINPKIYYRYMDCKKLMAMKEYERSQNPDLANQIMTNEIAQDYTKATSIYDFTLKDTYMNDISLAEYCRNKVVLIVNIASRCGFSESNYAQLTHLHKEHGDKLKILVFPSNQFKEMPEGDGDEMLCHLKVRKADPGLIMAKVSVNGDSANVLYKYLKEKVVWEDGPDLKWNFEKFVIDRNGQVFKRYHPSIEPMAIFEDIKPLF